MLFFAALCELPLVLFSDKFMDRFTSKALLLFAFGIISMEFTSYGLGLREPIKIALTFLAKHPGPMLVSMINLKVVSAIVGEGEQITALAFLSTVKNLTSSLGQSLAGSILDYTANSYQILFLSYLVLLIVGIILSLNFRITERPDAHVFQ